MVRFAAVIFDMDGVLLDSEPLHFAALATVLAHDGVALLQEENEEFIGTTVETTFGTLIERYHLARSLAEYIALYDAAVLEVLALPRPPAPGVAALIAAARSDGLRVALASSSRRPWIDATLRSLGLADAFDEIVSGDDVQRGKPDPEIYLLASTRLGVPPERCLAIEDSPNGVQSALCAGMAVIGVRTPSTAHLHLGGVLRTVDSLTDVSLTDNSHDSRAAALVVRLRQAAGALIDLVESIDDEQWLRVPAPGVWSVGKDAEHVADGAASHQWFVHLTLGHKVPPRPRIPREQLTAERSQSEVVALLRQRTEESAALIGGLSDEQLALPTRPPRARSETLGQTVERVLIGHYEVHRTSIEAKLETRVGENR